MFFKGVIFDLDNTIYDYDLCHQHAINNIYSDLSSEFNFDKKYISDILEYNKKIFKIESGNIASSHNRFIYFKMLFEELSLRSTCEGRIKIDIKNINKYYLNYWKYFFEKCRLNEGVLELLNFLKNKKIKMCILTDFTTNEQIQKIEHLNIKDYFDYIITSEEIGSEKPVKRNFETALKKLNLNSHETIMIGDNFEKDIQGANTLGIYGFYFNKSLKFKIDKEYITFSSFVELYQFFEQINKELIDFEKISKYCGERYDLIQAGGGNISFKLEELLFIKSSGVILSNVNTFNGYSVLFQSENIINKNKPSIETSMHTLLKKWTVHLHSIQINKILIKKDAKNHLEKIIENKLIIDYYTPGEKLFQEISKVYKGENIIFLLNHGVIFTSDNLDEIYFLIEDTVSKFEEYQHLDYSYYKNVNKISNCINNLWEINHITYLSDDSFINYLLKYDNGLFKYFSTNPDYIVYCGTSPLIINSLDIENFKKYKETENIPVLIIFDNKLFINSKNIYKCREIEQVLKSNLELVYENDNINFLPEHEINFLNNWDSEKYRKNL